MVDQVKVEFPNGMWSFLPEELHDEAMINVDAVIVAYIERLEEETRQRQLVTEKNAEVKDELARGLVSIAENNSRKVERFFTKARARLASQEAEMLKLRKLPLSAEELAARRRKEEKERKEAALEDWKEIQYRRKENTSYLSEQLRR